MASRLSSPRAITAEEILDYAVRELPLLKEFMEYDRTTRISGIHVSESQCDPRVVCVLPRPDEGRRPSGAVLFKRLLAIRYLSEIYEEWLQNQKEVPFTAVTRPHRPTPYGLCKTFLQRERLPDTSQFRNWFECGQKLLRLERRLGAVGIPLVLMFTLSKFLHLSYEEVDRAIGLLHDGDYPCLLESAAYYEHLFLAYNRFYKERIGIKRITERYG